jgi:hypothetical protein
MITGAQIRAGRKLLGWSPVDLAKRARIGAATIIRAEVADGEAPITIVNENAIRRALTDAGVEFIADDEAGPSVRMRKELS